MACLLDRHCRGGRLHFLASTPRQRAARNGIELATTDNGVSNTSQPLAAPVHYVDVTFNADSGTPYSVWLRLKALNNSKYNDAVWVQFSDATLDGSPIYPINTTSGLLV